MASNLREIFELKCLSELEDVTGLALLIGIVAVPLCLLTPLPQYYKLYKRGSTLGFSSLMLFMGNLGRAFNVLNLLILHYDQIKLCTARPGMLWECQPSLLVLYSGITGFLSMFPLYFAVMLIGNRRNVILGPSSGRSGQKVLWLGLFAQVLVISFACMPIITLLKKDQCKPLQTYANIVGFLNTFFLCTQFLPQIVLTWTRREGGAVSYLMYVPDVIGGYIMTAEKAFGTHERISTWLPYALMHTLELIMLLLNAAFDEACQDWFNTYFRAPKLQNQHLLDDFLARENSSIMKRRSVDHNYLRSRVGTRSPPAELLEDLNGDVLLSRSTDSLS
mmetsp:Transcript_11577/g.35380  ORF Transcript_11577/g.35380 Transcript_11577/m.35380 type:complete len:334 (+) Transcript_11577:213-1214(+)